MKKLCFVGVMLSAIALTLAGCWNSKELTELAIVVGLGIDKGEEKGTYKVSFQIVNPGAISMGKMGGGGGQTMPITVYSGVDNTLFGALRKSTQKVPRQLFFSHIQLLILGEDLAKEGVKEVFDLFDRSRELRMNTPVVVARGASAETMLSIVTPLENLPAVGIAKRLEVSSDVFAQNIETEIMDIIKGFSGEGGIAISGVQMIGDPKEGQSRKNTSQTKLPTSIEMKGIGLFREGKLQAWAEGKAARGMLWIKNQMKGTAMDVACGDKPEGTSIELTHSVTDVSVKMRGGRPAFRIHVREEGAVTEVHCDIDLGKHESIVKLQNIWAKETEKEIRKAVELAQKEKIDVFGFGDALNRQYPNVWKQIKRDWPKTFADSEVEVEVEAYVRRTGMRLKSYL
ncbi:Ger(x)C family spore germination protein [Paenibacillus sp.]|uniref:Ger(x)C family spore germination protein n=1 Tax=Paenibacillus sp. TaxID=58172 RepID=UPI002D31C136|nr:Ger(x)C family spore germination protein [Paenibacillus sp.]HZG86794.1 Ger(x)C family spore germination protein [Paenibacillus sp.]